MKFFFSVFTKPWKTQEKEELALLVKNLGFGGIEFPLRDGYQVEPDNAEKGMPVLADIFAKYGLKIGSVASDTRESVFAGCAAAGIPLIRMMPVHDLKMNYLESEARMKREIEAFLPLCEKYNVKVGIQHHYGPGINNSMELLHLLEPFDPKYVGAIWDTAHSGLAGEEPEQGLDIVSKYLMLVNFKNAFYKRHNGPEGEPAQFSRYFTTGPHGLGKWERAIRHIKKLGYEGNICLTAEYTDEEKVNEYAAKDIVYIKGLFNEVFGPGSY